MTRFDLKNKKKIHFVGIGGIGMSGVALILLELGHAISGSDLKDNNLVKQLRSKGANISIDHKDSNLKEDVDMVIYSSCIKKDNPELVKAKSLNIPLVHRQAMLAALMQKNKGIAITGAHGKSTTTALTSTIFLKAGFDPTVAVGAEVADLGGNARLGKGEFFIIEADESDGSFVELEPYYAVITNVDREHLDHYKNMDNIIKASRTFVDKIKEGGLLFYLDGDEQIVRILKGYKKKYKTFGLSSKSNIYAKDINIEGLVTTFKCVYDDKNLGTFKLMLPGKHNVLNALAATAVALETRAKLSVIKDVLANYRGALRRFEVKGSYNDILVIEDYAHHPTEIKANLEVCKGWNKGRVISIFQPHRYSRTKLLADDFAKAFKLTDELILTHIYSAHEKILKDVSSKLIFDKLKEDGKDNIKLLPKEEIVDYLRTRIKKNDTILVLGAGDIGDISLDIVKMVKKK